MGNPHSQDPQHFEKSMTIFEITGLYPGLRKPKNMVECRSGNFAECKRLGMYEYVRLLT